MKNEMWLIWKESKSRKRFVIGTLTKNEKKFIFKYINPELNEAKKAGFEYFPGFEEINKIYESQDLFANIKTRLPNPARPDYLEILNFYNLDKDSSDFDILKETKGRLLTDNYEFVPAFDKNKINFEVAGTRHYHDIQKCKKELSVNSKLYLEIDEKNEHDKYAIKVIYKSNNKNYLLGYVPRYYSKQLCELLKDNIKYSARIQSVNFESKISDENISTSVKLIFDVK